MSGLKSYIPSKGDIITLNFDPSTGKEMQKRRPALVLSNRKYSELTGLALVCPITTSTTNRFVQMGIYIPVQTDNIQGSINPLQFHTFDFRTRQMKYVEKVNKKILNQVLEMVNDIVNAEEER